MKNQFLVERDVMFFGLRYSLGRRTFAPSTMVENIKNNLDKFTDNDISLMMRDIGEHKGMYGDKCDEDLWLGFIIFLKEELKRRELV